MATLVANTTVRGENGFPVVLTAGSELPEWAEGLVGEHLLTGGVKKPAKTAVKSEPVDSGSPDFTKPAPKRRRS